MLNVKIMEYANFYYLPVEKKIQDDINFACNLRPKKKKTKSQEVISKLEESKAFLYLKQMFCGI